MSMSASMPTIEANFILEGVVMIKDMTKSDLRKVSGLTDTETQRIKDYMLGSIYCWIKNQKDGDSSLWFAVRDLVGGENTKWDGTPLDVIYKKHLHEKTSDEAFEQAAKDIGWIMKSVIFEDKRLFETKKEGMVRKYRWITNEHHLA